MKFEIFNKNDNDVKSDLLYNSPVEDSFHFRMEIEELYKGVNNPDCKNIGILGTYGSGKSSLIKTFINKYYKKSRKINYISLAKFYDSKKVEYSEREIEKNILEQLFFKVLPGQLPRSNIKKINRHFIFWLVVTLFSAFIFIALLFHFIILFISNSGKKFFDSSLDISDLILKILVPSLLSIVLLFLTIFLIIRNIKLSKIAFKGIELTISNEKESLIDIYIDEILYFFEKTKTSILIIEDLDRFDSTFIFQKLRELNFFVNNANSIKNKVTFIYCIKEGIFSSDEEKAKFFDLIITIVPYLNNLNCADRILSKLKIQGSAYLIDKIDAYNLSSFINDNRILNSIINDYYIYQNKINIYNDKNNRKNAILFALMSYKNLYPKGFVELEEGSGICAEIIKKIREEYNKLIIEKKNEYNEKRNSNIIDGSDNLAFIRVKEMIIGHIMIHGTRNVGFTGIYKNIADINNINDLTMATGYWINVYGNNQKFLLRESFEAFYKKKIIEFYNDLTLANMKEIKKNSEILNQLIDEISNLKRASLSEILIGNNEIYDKILDDYKNKPTYKEVKYLIFSIKNGYITEDYFNYLFNSDDVLLTKNDSKFLQEIILGIHTDKDKLIDNPKLLCSILLEKNFSYEQCLNFTLVNTMLNSCEYYLSSKKATLIDFLSSNKSITNKFIIDYVRSTNDIDSLLNNMNLKEFHLIEMLLNSDLTIIEKEMIISKLIKKDLHCVVNANFNHCVSNYLASRNDSFYFIYNNVSENNEQTINLIKFLDINFQNIEYEASLIEQVQEIVDFIIRENKYTISTKNVNFLLFYIGLFDESNKNKLSTLLGTYAGQYSNIFSQRFKEFVTWESNQPNFIEENDFICKVLNSHDIDPETRKKYIDNMGIKLDNLGVIDIIDVIIYLIESNKLKSSWENIYSFYNKNSKKLDKCLRDYIELNINNLGTYSLKDYDFMEQIIFNLNYKNNFEVFKKIANCFNKLKIKHYALINNLSIDETLYILHEKMIEINSYSFLHIYNTFKNEDIISEIVELMVLINENIITTSNFYNIISEDVYNKLLISNNINNKNKILIIKFMLNRHLPIKVEKNLDELIRDIIIDIDIAKYLLKYYEKISLCNKMYLISRFRAFLDFKMVNDTIDKIYSCSDSYYSGNNLKLESNNDNLNEESFSTSNGLYIVDIKKTYFLIKKNAN